MGIRGLEKRRDGFGLVAGRGSRSHVLAELWAAHKLGYDPFEIVTDLDSIPWCWLDGTVQLRVVHLVADRVVHGGS